MQERAFLFDCAEYLSTHTTVVLFSGFRRIPGGGGRYGTIDLPNDDEKQVIVSLKAKDKQTSLTEY